jgi:hypothetical protein
MRWPEHHLPTPERATARTKRTFFLRRRTSPRLATLDPKKLRARQAIRVLRRDDPADGQRPKGLACGSGIPTEWPVSPRCDGGVGVQGGVRRFDDLSHNLDRLLGGYQ